MKVTQSCLTLCDPVDCNPPGSSVYGILQARILEWVVISFSTLNSFMLTNYRNGQVFEIYSLSKLSQEEIVNLNRSSLEVEYNL